MEIDRMEIDPEVIKEQPIEDKEVTIGKWPERARELTAEQKQMHWKQGRCFVCGQQVLRSNGLKRRLVQYVVFGKNKLKCKC